MKHWEHALRINPDLAEAHNNLAVALLQEGKVTNAAEHLEQALRLNPNDAETHCNLGNAYEQAGRLTDAIEQYQEALRTMPGMTRARDGLIRLKAIP
jgi:tetratricopeptide (TPR) repeat protein